MANHSQVGADKTYVCAQCMLDRCGLCIDVLRSTYADRALCMCRRNDHAVDLERAVERERAGRMTDPAQPHIACGLCQRTSYNPTDIATGYCGYCHDFTNGEVE